MKKFLIALLLVTIVAHAAELPPLKRGLSPKEGELPSELYKKIFDMTYPDYRRVRCQGSHLAVQAQRRQRDSFQAYRAVSLEYAPLDQLEDFFDAMPQCREKQEIASDDQRPQLYQYEGPNADEVTLHIYVDRCSPEIHLSAPPPSPENKRERTSRYCLTQPASFKRWQLFDRKYQSPSFNEVFFAHALGKKHFIISSYAHCPKDVSSEHENNEESEPKKRVKPWFLRLFAWQQSLIGGPHPFLVAELACTQELLRRSPVPLLSVSPFHRLSFLTDRTLLGMTLKKELYVVAHDDHHTLSLYYQKLPFPIKDFAVDRLSPTRVFFVSEDNGLYYANLKKIAKRKIPFVALDQPAAASPALQLAYLAARDDQVLCNYRSCLNAAQNSLVPSLAHYRLTTIAEQDFKKLVKVAAAEIIIKKDAAKK